VPVKPVALSAHPDEPAWGLFEGPRRVTMPDGTIQSRWVQEIKVVRGDRLAYFVSDFGPAEDFEDIPPLAMPSYGTDTVAQLQEFGERHRHDDTWAKRRKEQLAGSTLISDILRQEEIKLEVVRNRSHFGPLVNVQRDDFPREAVRQRRKEQRVTKHR